MNIDFEKLGGLVPAIIQHCKTGQVLMLGFMNKEAYDKTVESGWVTFFSRKRQTLWMKGETSGNRLKLESIAIDCDEDSLLVQATPEGPTCHTGKASCFGEQAPLPFMTLFNLETTVESRKVHPTEGSYTASLFKKGMGSIAQKVGEEGVEVVRAALTESDERVRDESADLLYHLIVLLSARNIRLGEVFETLEARTRPAAGSPP